MNNQLVITQLSNPIVGLGMSFIKNGLEIMKLSVTNSPDKLEQYQQLKEMVSIVEDSVFKKNSEFDTIQMPENTPSAIDYYINNIIKSPSITGYTNDKTFFSRPLPMNKYDKIISIIENLYISTGKALFILMGTGVPEVNVVLPLIEASLLYFLIEERKMGECNWLLNPEKYTSVLETIYSNYNINSDQIIPWVHDIDRRKLVVKKINITVKNRTNIKGDLIVKTNYSNRGIYKITDSIGSSNANRISDNLTSHVSTIEKPFTIKDEKLFNEFKEKHNFVAHSHAMLKVFKQIKKAAKTKVTVIITGESGTGKEFVAKAIHDESKRKDEPFISKHCGSIMKGAVDVTLFGCIAKYLTGVPDAQDGLFTKADGGTIFLDEFADLPGDTQDKLLEVLDYKKINIVGKQTKDDVNVKVIVATNKNLGKLIEENKFREDLYFRINNYPIALPPISERINDIPLIAPILFLSCLKDILELTDNGVQDLVQTFMKDPKTYEILKTKNWKNNVRGIRNHLERVITEIQDDLPSIKLLDFKKVLNNPSYNFKQHKDSEVEDSIFRGNEYIEALNAYIESDYDMTAAAKKLEIDRGTETTRVLSAVLRLGHLVNFELHKIPDILNENGIIVKDDEHHDLLTNMHAILVKIINQTINKRARKAYKSEDEKLYLTLVEARPDLVAIAKNK